MKRLYREDIGKLPSGYTEDDFAEMLDKEEPGDYNMEEDNVYDPDDEEINFEYIGPDDGISELVYETFEPAADDTLSVATIGELKHFIDENNCDADEFDILDKDGEMYEDNYALIYDGNPDQDMDLVESFFNSKKGKRLSESLIAGANGLQYCDDNNNPAKHAAADNLLRKIGMLKD